VSDPRFAGRTARRGAVRRSRRTSYGSVSGARPDRVAGWAVALGIFLILVATATSHGATSGGVGADSTADDLSGGSSSLSPSVAQMSARRATWYGPGLYDRPTACGVRLRRFTLGVAHRRLPCGTLVRFYYRGRHLTVPVIDRGPHRRGIVWDLTAASARRLGLKQTSTIRSLPLP
jgi:hypothetical protein